MRSMEEINAFDGSRDFRPVARRALKELMEERMEEEIAEKGKKLPGTF